MNVYTAVTYDVQVGHGEVDHTGMAPHAPRVERDPLRDQPQLRGDAVDAAPVVHTEEAEVELPPGGSLGDPAVAVDEGARVLGGEAVGGDAEEAQGDVVEDGSEHCT